MVTAVAMVAAMRKSTIRFAGAFLASVSLTLAACSAGPGSTNGASDPSASLQPWPQGSVHGTWQVVFDGYGQVQGSATTVVLEPNIAEERDVTHGALVVDQSAPAAIDATVTVRTEHQLRTPQPNPWEVGWVLWRYQDPNRFYAIALKPNGWELSKQDTAYPGFQRFLTSGDTPVFPVGEPHTVTIRHRGDTMSVSANGTELTTFTDTERPYSEGGLALYTEDARVAFTDFRIDELPEQ